MYDNDSQRPFHLPDLNAADFELLTHRELVGVATYARDLQTMVSAEQANRMEELSLLIPAVASHSPEKRGPGRPRKDAE